MEPGKSKWKIRKIKNLKELKERDIKDKPEFITGGFAKSEKSAKKKKNKQSVGDASEHLFDQLFINSPNLQFFPPGIFPQEHMNYVKQSPLSENLNI